MRGGVRTDGELLGGGARSTRTRSDALGHLSFGPPSPSSVSPFQTTGHRIPETKERGDGPRLSCLSFCRGLTATWQLPKLTTMAILLSRASYAPAKAPWLSASRLGHGGRSRIHGTAGGVLFLSPP